MDLGPGRYFVTSIGGSTDEQTMRYFIMSSPCYSIRLRSCCCSWPRSRALSLPRVRMRCNKQTKCGSGNILM